MCTNFSTRNRAVILNNYSVQTLLVNRNDYCPNGPNTQDYTRRSRLYNPDPKYACHSDLTCHQYDSIPKGNCGNYGSPQGQGQQYSCCGGSAGAPGTTIPCIAPLGGCYPPACNDCQQPPEPSCVRTRIKPPGCCRTRPTYKDLIQSMQCPCPLPICPPPCCPEEEDLENMEDCNEEDEDQQNSQEQSCYSLVVPPEMGDCCGSKVTYNFGPSGINRSVQTRGGHQICMPCQDDSVTLETYGGPGGCCIGNSGLRVESKCTPYSCCIPCCPPPPPQSCGVALCCPPPCPRRCPPPPCRNRRKIRCSPFARNTVGPDIGCGCQCMVFRPPFRNP